MNTTRIRHHGSVLSDVFCASNGSGVVYGFGCRDGSGFCKCFGYGSGKGKGSGFGDGFGGGDGDGDGEGNGEGFC